MSSQEADLQSKLGQSKNKTIVSRLNTFRVGLVSGALLTALAIGGVSYLYLNVFKLGAVTFGDKSLGVVASPINVDGRAQAGDNSKVEKNELTSTDSDNTIQAVDSQVNQNSPSASGDPLGNSEISGENVTVTINYSNNSELPGFNESEGYRTDPPDISKFNRALLITNVSLGDEYAQFSTNKIFINKRGYSSTFSLKSNDTSPTRVGFSLEAPGVSPNAIFLQFGLEDLPAGSTTLTYLVSIFGDGEILWSNQVKYEESQIASVVLEVRGFNDIVVEYQVVEMGDIAPYELKRHPLFFTEAKLLS